MCHFILVCVETDSAAAILERELREMGRRFEPDAIRAPPGGSWSPKRWFSTTTGHCDCGTAIGSGPADVIDLRKPEKKGWSQAKIDRWVRDRAKAKAKRGQGASGRERDDGPTIERWTAAVETVLGRGHQMGILLAWMSGDLIVCEGCEEVPSGELEHTLLNAKDNILYWIV